MPKVNTLCALDIGSSQVVAVLAGQDAVSRKIEILSASQIATRGIRGGVVVNIPETAKAIGQAIELCEEKLGGKEVSPVQDIILGVRGSHFQSFNNKGAYNIARTDKEIAAGDVESVLEIAKAFPISGDREVLHAIAQDFWVDRQKGVPNPVGMEGSLLEVDVHILTGTSSHLNNAVKAVNQAGFRVQNMIYGLFGLGETVVTPEEKQQGCLLVDLGGETLALGVFSESSLRYSKEIALGSDAVSRDLAYALRTSLINANRLKEEHGACLSSLVEAEEEVEFYGIDGREVRRVKKKTIVEIIQPRTEEIFSLIAKELDTAGWLEVIVPGGVILTGGGSQLRGLCEAATELLGVPARLGLPRSEDFAAPNECLANAAFATAVALLYYSQNPPLWGVTTNGRSHLGLEFGLGRKTRHGLSRKVQNFLEELFS